MCDDTIIRKIQEGAFAIRSRARHEWEISNLNQPCSSGAVQRVPRSRADATCHAERVFPRGSFRPHLCGSPGLPPGPPQSAAQPYFSRPLVLVTANSVADLASVSSGWALPRVSVYLPSKIARFPLSSTLDSAAGIKCDGDHPAAPGWNGNPLKPCQGMNRAARLRRLEISLDHFIAASRACVGHGDRRRQRIARLHGLRRELNRPVLELGVAEPVAETPQRLAGVSSGKCALSARNR